MTITQAIEFYSKYTGLLSNEEIHEETGMTVPKIRRKKRENKGQLCWRCAKACDDFKCSWIRKCHGTQEQMADTEYPDYVQTETFTKDIYKRGQFLRTETATYIVGCENYEWDGRSK